MSELYSTSETDDTAPAPETPPPPDTGSPQYEEPAQTDDVTPQEETLDGDDYTSDDDDGTLAAEEEGLGTRQEAWEQTWGENPESYDENDPASQYDGDASALAAEEEGLPTRQEAREQTWGDDPGPSEENEPATGYEGDTSSLAAEEEGLPTRQEEWDQTWGDAAGDQAADAQSTVDADTRSEDDRGERETARNEPPATTVAETEDSDAESAPSEQVTVHDQYGHDVPITVVHATAEDRTLGDDTPTGAGLKPTGDRLLHMENDSESYVERLRKNIYDRADDISDAADEYGGTLGHLFERPPTESHAVVPTGPAYTSGHTDQGIDGGHLATAGLVVGVVGFELFRAVKNKVKSQRRT